MYKNQTISLVIPCFNEEEGLKKILPTLPDFIDEAIVVNNNSTDDTAKVAADLGVKVVFEKKKGYGRAIWTGVLASRGDIAAIMDGDGAHSVQDVCRLAAHLIDNDLNAVWGTRLNSIFKNQMPFLNYLGNRILSLILSVLFGKRVNDSQSGMMAFRRDFLQRFRPESTGMAFSEEIKMAAVLSGLKWREVGINYFPRIGQSKLNMWRVGFLNLFFLFYCRVRFIFRHPMSKN